MSKKNVNQGRRVCVYFTNQHTAYLNMVCNSIRMLRVHNQTIPVRVFLLEDHAKNTYLQRAGIKKGLLNVQAMDRFEELCEQYRVEIVKKQPNEIETDGDDFILLRRDVVYKTCPEESVLCIDGDTFIFGDVEQLFNIYEDSDFTAVQSHWMHSSPGWSIDLLPKCYPPICAGVMLWNNGWLQKWEVVEICRQIKERKLPVSDWLYQVHGDCAHREEFSIPFFLAKHKLKLSFFDEVDCRVPLIKEDLLTPERSIIFHSYTQNWRSVFQRLYPLSNGKKMTPKMLIRRQNEHSTKIKKSRSFKTG